MPGHHESTSSVLNSDTARGSKKTAHNCSAAAAKAKGKSFWTEVSQQDSF